jgi:phage protein D
MSGIMAKLSGVISGGSGAIGSKISQVKEQGGAEATKQTNNMAARNPNIDKAGGDGVQKASEQGMMSAEADSKRNISTQNRQGVNQAENEQSTARLQNNLKASSALAGMIAKMSDNIGRLLGN